MSTSFKDADKFFLDLVSFKWLMAGRGWWVDLSRTQRDPAYARMCAQRGLDSGSELLRQRSTALLDALPEHADAGLVSCPINSEAQNLQG
jgi:hypothetical protein